MQLSTLVLLSLGLVMGGFAVPSTPGPQTEVVVPYDVTPTPPAPKFQEDGRHELRFTLNGCPESVKPKIAGTSGSQGQYTPTPPKSIIVPSDFIGSIYLTGEGCGKYGDNCQSIELTFQSNPSNTVRSCINYDAMQNKKFLFPVKARFDDTSDTSKDASIDCDNYNCVDGSTDPDDFITNRIYSSTKGVGVDIAWDCSFNSTAAA